MSRTQQRALAVLAVILAALVALWVRNAVRSAYATLPSVQTGDSTAYLTVQNAVVQGRVHGHLRWRVRADTLDFSRDRATVTATHVHDGRLYDDAGRAALSLSAGRAVFFATPGALQGGPDALKSGALTLTGGITAGVLSPGGPVVRGQTLTWDGARQIARASGGASALFPPGPTAIGGLRLQTGALQWAAADGTLSAPGTTTAQFAGGARASGANAVVFTRTGNVSLRGLHVTFPVPPGTLLP